MEIKAETGLFALGEAFKKMNLNSSDLLGFEVREIVEEQPPVTSLFNPDEPLIEPEDLRE
jgi:hypothetical protein